MFTGSPVDLAFGAVFSLLLVAGCVSDLRSRKIHNELVAAILGTGWLFALYSPDRGNVGFAMAMSLAGTAVGFGIWIAFYLAGAIGAGDVKFFAAAGAWLGPGMTWRAALIAAVAGGVLAVGMLLYERRLGTVLRKFALAASARSLSILPEKPGATTKHRQLPYGVALAVGALVAAWLPRIS
jgi:prepilin peptidase CpaA